MTDTRPTSTRLRSTALIAGMAIGSIILWFGIPLFWVLVASQVLSKASPTMGPILLVLIATPFTMVLFAPLLGRMDRAHRELRGAVRKGPRRAAWNKSMRDSSPDHADHGVLELVMIVSVAVALLIAGGWLALFGKMTLPS
jgi:hypothetical protein